MATLRDIRRRIRSVQKTQQITSAMRMVAAAKLRRAQDAILAARPYSQQIWATMYELGRREKELEATETALGRANQKLKNSDFCDKAPPQVIQGVRDERDRLEKKAQTLRAYLEELTE